MEITYKHCEINDLDLLVEISITTFKDTFGSQNTESDMSNYLAQSFNIDQLRSELQTPSMLFYFAYVQEQLIGYFKVNFAPSQSDINDACSLELERIYILKAFQGKKYGKALLDKVISIAQSNNKQYLWLGVWEKNERAIRVYEKKGFIQFDKHDFLLGKDLQTDILMKLML